MAMLDSNDFEISYPRTITNDFSEEQKIGSDGFGAVYRGVHNGEEIAVKKLHQLQGLDDMSFVNECRILMGVNHPNVIQLIGYCYEKRYKFVEYNGELGLATAMEQLLCYEYLQGGSLDKYIGDNSCELDWPTCYQIIKGTCEGLNYLHNDQKNPIFHLDLNPSNILLDNNMATKISGFDQCRIPADPENTFATATFLGRIEYMPPEYIKRYLVSSKHDIYSLGVTIIKMIAGHRGTQCCHEMAPKDFIDLVTQTWEKKLQDTLTSSSYEIAISQVKKCAVTAIKCVEADRRKRPCIMDILHEL